MKNLNQYYVALFLLIGLSQSVFSQQNSEKIWVTFQNAQAVPTLVDGRLTSSNQNVQALMEEYSVIGVEQAIPSSKQEALRKVYEVECNCDAAEFSTAIEKNSIELINPEIAPKYELMNTPDDYNAVFATDYALDLINAQGAWDYSTGDTNTIIGISDGNYFTDHEDLVGEFVEMDYTNPSSEYSHGTAVAITAAGKTNNATGKSSIGYDCKLNLFGMNYNKVLEMSYNGVRVINLSWATGCSYSSYIQELIDEVYANGTILVAAAGNGGTCGGSSNLVYPAAHNHVIAVSSVGPLDNHERTIGDPATTHQHNSSVDICAPGYDVALTVASGNYITGNGSSFAAPYVSGTIGLMLSLKPCLTFEEVVEILTQSAVNIDAQNPSYIGMLGAGRLNANAALALTKKINCKGNNGNGGIAGNGGNGNGGNGNGGNGNGGNGNGGNGGNGSGDHGKPQPEPTLALGTYDDVENIAQVESMEESLIQVKLYPNPTTSTSNITWDLQEEMTLIVVDVRGVVVHQQNLSAEMRVTTIDLQDNGVYFLKLEKNGQPKWHGKLVKM